MRLKSVVSKKITGPASPLGQSSSTTRLKPLVSAFSPVSVPLVLGSGFHLTGLRNGCLISASHFHVEEKLSWFMFTVCPRARGKRCRPQRKSQQRFCCQTLPT